MTDAYLIWSIEHTAWWKPGGWGYSARLEEAGRFSREQATRIVADANLVDFHECMIPIAALGLGEAHGVAPPMYGTAEFPPRGKADV